MKFWWSWSKQYHWGYRFGFRILPYDKFNNYILQIEVDLWKHKLELTWYRRVKNKYMEEMDAFLKRRN